jgi:hypothetical protein
LTHLFKPTVTWRTIYGLCAVSHSGKDAVLAAARAIAGERLGHFVRYATRKLREGDAYVQSSVPERDAWNAEGRIIDEIRKHVPGLAVEFVDTRIMNQLSYHVDNARFRGKGFTSQLSKNAVEVVLLTGGLKPTPEAQPTPRTSAEVPKVNLMLFDLNVIYQDKQYDRFPCANFIYNAGDAFPLKREFVSTLVFHGP